jgi:hypothetical protein
MKCSTFRKAWEPGLSDPHALACGACGEWVATQRDLRSSLARLAARVGAAEAPGREAELRAAFRASHGTVSPRPQLGWFLGWAAAASFAAFVALVVSVSSPSLPRQQAHARPVSPAPAASPSAKPRSTSEPAKQAGRATTRSAPATPEESGSVPQAPAAPAAAPEAVAPRVHEPPEVEVADAASVEDGPSRSEQSFYPLVPGRETSAIESGQIVRVQLRPDVLSAAGLPSRTLGSSPVEAEVLMGPDGVAVGIRLPRPKR